MPNVGRQSPHLWMIQLGGLKVHKRKVELAYTLSVEYVMKLGKL